MYFLPNINAYYTIFHKVPGSKYLSRHNGTRMFQMARCSFGSTVQLTCNISGSRSSLYYAVTRQETIVKFLLLPFATNHFQ